MKHTTTFTLTGLVAGIALATMSSSAMAQEKWTMTTTWPENLDLIAIDKHWAELVNQLAGDEVQIEFYAGGTLMPGTEVFDATETGSIQAAGDWPGYWAGRSPAFSPLATTTSLFNGVDYLNWITQWGGFELYQEIYGQYNMVYLPYGITNNESGFRGGTPIESIADIEGKRLRLSGRDQGRVLEQLGGSQVTLAGGEIYQAIERGVVDGAEVAQRLRFASSLAASLVDRDGGRVLGVARRLPPSRHRLRDGGRIGDDRHDRAVHHRDGRRRPRRPERRGRRRVARLRDLLHRRGPQRSPDRR